MVSRLEFNSYFTGGVSDLAIAFAVATQLPGRQVGGPADVARHLVLAAELTRRFGADRARDLLALHELEDTQQGVDTAHDQYINDIGVAMGEFVLGRGGTFLDVLDLATQALEQSFGPWNYFESQSGGNWILDEKGYFLPPVPGIHVNLNGVQLGLPPLALTPIHLWEQNPKDANGKEIPTSDANWPDADFRANFYYEPGNKALSYSDQYNPIGMLSLQNLLIADYLRNQGPIDIIAPCFSAGTPILLADGTSIAIEDVTAGMRVAAFDERDAAGTGALTSGLVTRLIPGITTEWIVLDDASSARLREATRVTPGHRYLRPDGTFTAIADIIAGDGLVVDADGTIAHVTGTLLRATDAGSDATWIEPDPIDAAANENAGAFQMRVAGAGTKMDSYLMSPSYMRLRSFRMIGIATKAKANMYNPSSESSLAFLKKKVSMNFSCTPNRVNIKSRLRHKREAIHTIGMIANNDRTKNKAR